MRRILLAIMAVLMAVGVAGCPGPAGKPRTDQPQRQEPTISVYMHETGQVRQMKLEEYLLGVVAAEMDPNWPDNALAAQAILARTFTMKKIQEGGVKARGTDASTDIQEFQAYDASGINDKVRQAVQRTRGEVVTYRGRYINGWFFADGGGLTSASAAEGLAFRKEPAPYIHSVKDPGFAITAPENKAWSARIPLSKVRQAVQQATGQDPGAITTARVTARGPSGRATTVQLGKSTISAPALRLAVGSEVMRSTLLTSFRIEGEHLVVSGKGYGHGVGMSQWGARALAEQGKSPEDIVRYFFRGVKIEKHWN